MTTDYNGLALPAIRTAGGYFASKNRYMTAWGDLMIAIFVPIGSYPMNRNFGSGLHRSVFDYGSSGEDAMKYAIRSSAERYCPHILIKGIEIVQVDRCVRIRIAFQLIDEDITVTNELDMQQQAVQNQIGRPA